MSNEVKKTRTKPYRVLEEDLVNINMMLAKKGISFQAYVDNLIKKDIDRFLNEYKNGGKNTMDFEMVDLCLSKGDTILDTMDTYKEEHTIKDKIIINETVRIMTLLEQMLDRQDVVIDGETITSNEYINDNTIVNYLLDSLDYLYRNFN